MEPEQEQGGAWLGQQVGHAALDSAAMHEDGGGRGFLPIPPPLTIFTPAVGCGGAGQETAFDDMVPCQSASSRRPGADAK